MTSRRAIALWLALTLPAAGCSVGTDVAQDTVDSPTVAAAADPTTAPAAPSPSGRPTPDASSTDGERTAEAADSTEPTPTTDQGAPPAASRFAGLAGDLEIQVDQVLGHDPTAFSQGLLFEDGRLFESRGQYGQSALTEIDPASGEVIRRVDLDEAFFAEGLALVDDRLIQLTWQEQVAFVWDLDTFEAVGQFSYEGEGWGLCHDGADLWMSDGSATLTRRDPVDFTPLELVDVTLDGQPVVRLNELECIHGLVWANVWLTDLIVVIDPTSGDVVATIDAAGLLEEVEATGGEDVLNGIAYDPARDVVVLTGKNWPAMFEVTVLAD